MKNWIWAVIVVVVAAGILLESRYALIVNSPIVAKLDKVTGDVWIVNSGMWRKVQQLPKDEAVRETAATRAPATTEKKTK